MKTLTADEQLNRFAERIVVDEVLDDETTRLLRARRRPDERGTSLAMATWQDEEIDVLEVWQVEAFVGFPATRKLREGDVFFVKDGRKLNAKYKPIKRETARQKHLLVDWDEGREMARNEMKEQYRLLNMVHAEAGAIGKKTWERQVKKAVFGSGKGGN